MKKMLIMAMAVCFATTLSFAQPAKADSKKGEEFKAKREQMRKDFQEMKDLVEKYNAETDAKKKTAIEDQVKAKVAGNYDKHLAKMEERVKDSEKRLAETKKKLNESKKKANKEKHVNEVTKKILSGEKPTLFGPPQNGDKKFEGKKFEGKRGFGKKGDFKGDRRGDRPAPCPCGNPDMKGPAPEAI